MLASSNTYQSALCFVCFTVHSQGSRVGYIVSIIMYLILLPDVCSPPYTDSVPLT
jgi:hypothetical protein